MARTKGLFRRIVFMSLLIIIAAVLVARSEAALNFLQEYSVVITVSMSLIFLLGFFLRWKHKDTA